MDNSLSATMSGKTKKKIDGSLPFRSLPGVLGSRSCTTEAAKNWPGEF